MMTWMATWRVAWDDVEVDFDGGLGGDVDGALDGGLVCDMDGGLNSVCKAYHG